MMEMNAMAYFESLLHVLEQNSAYNFELALKVIDAKGDQIRTSVLMQLTRDHYGLQQALDGYKAACCGLLLRGLQLIPQLKGKKGIKQLERLIVLVALIKVLEELYSLYRSVQEVPLQEL